MATPLSRRLRLALERAAPGGVRIDVDLSRLSRWRVGGLAAALVEPATIEEVAAVMRTLSLDDVPRLVVGETSNLLFDDAGFDGVLVRIGPRMSGWSIDGTTVRARAGSVVPMLVRAVAEAGLGGIVHAAGVPGTIGGLVLMNGGTQRRGVGEHVASVTVVDEQGIIERISRAELHFAYRSSSLQGRSTAIVEVELRLELGDPIELVCAIDGIIAERAEKFPLDLPSCGSTFLSDPAMYATVGPPGKAIEDAGLKGLRRGGAQISEKHANFIVNLGDATSADILHLIGEIHQIVHARTGFRMACEVRYVSPAGNLMPADQALSF